MHKKCNRLHGKNYGKCTKTLYLKKKCVILIADCQRGNKWADGDNAVEDSTS